jgi:hypothetical protein
MAAHQFIAAQTCENEALLVSSDPESLRILFAAKKNSEEAEQTVNK